MERRASCTRHSYVKRRSWLAIAGAVLLASASACASDDGPSTHKSLTDEIESSDLVDGDAAVWSISRGVELTSETTSFTANVSRLDCNSGVTGKVLEPQLDYGDSQVILTFGVEPAAGGAHDCQGNQRVPYKVVLTEPVGARELVDGACLDDEEAGTTSHCSPDGVRWPG